MNGNGLSLQLHEQDLFIDVEDFPDLIIISDDDDDDESVVVVDLYFCNVKHAEYNADFGDGIMTYMVTIVLAPVLRVCRSVFPLEGTGTRCKTFA